MMRFRLISAFFITLVLFYPCSHEAQFSLNGTKEIKLGVTIPWTGDNWDAGPRFASGILIAIDKVNNDPTLLPGLNLTFEWKDSKCEESVGLTAAVDLYSTSTPKIHALIGPACSAGCKAVGYLASHWNMPLISYACGSVELSDKRSFPTFARTVGVYSKSGDIIVGLMKWYKWDRVAILTSTSFLWASITAGVRQDVEKNGMKISFYQNFNEETVTDEQLANLFTKASKKAHGRIFKVFILQDFQMSARLCTECIRKKFWLVQKTQFQLNTG